MSTSYMSQEELSKLIEGNSNVIKVTVVEDHLHVIFNYQSTLVYVVTHYNSKGDTLLVYVRGGMLFPNEIGKHLCTLEGEIAISLLKSLLAGESVAVLDEALR